MRLGFEKGGRLAKGEGREMEDEREWDPVVVVVVDGSLVGGVEVESVVAGGVPLGEPDGEVVVGGR